MAVLEIAYFLMLLFLIELALYAIASHNELAHIQHDAQPMRINYCLIYETAYWIHNYIDAAYQLFLFLLLLKGVLLLCVRWLFFTLYVSRVEKDGRILNWLQWLEASWRTKNKKNWHLHNWSIVTVNMKNASYGSLN